MKDEGGEEEDADEEEGAAGNGTKRRSGRKNDGPRADEWLEVYLVKTSSWVCVDTERGVGMPHLCSQNATAPITYVVSVDGDGFVKDLGRKYDPTWLTSSRKRRVDEEWWEETLQPFLGPEDERDMKEEKEVRPRDMLTFGPNGLLYTQATAASFSSALVQRSPHTSFLSAAPEQTAEQTPARLDSGV